MHQSKIEFRFIIKMKLLLQIQYVSTFFDQVETRHHSIWSLNIDSKNEELFQSYLIETVTFFACPSHAMTTVPSGALNSAV